MRKGTKEKTLFLKTLKSPSMVRYRVDKKLLLSPHYFCPITLGKTSMRSCCAGANLLMTLPSMQFQERKCT